jgi:hypothetical protein
MHFQPTRQDGYRPSAFYPFHSALAWELSIELSAKMPSNGGDGAYRFPETVQPGLEAGPTPKTSRTAARLSNPLRGNMPPFTRRAAEVA